VITKRRGRPAQSKIVQNLCFDKGYDFQEIEYEAIKRGYVPHIRHKGEKKKNRKRKKRHRERRRKRKLLIRYEKRNQKIILD
jgi:putative transposase